MSESDDALLSESTEERRSLAMTPTWSVASVLTVFVVVSLLVERSIHRLGNVSGTLYWFKSLEWLKKTDRKPLLAAVEKMKEELMLLGFISLLLTATSSIISSICIPSKFYDSAFTPCTKRELDEERENDSLKERKLLMPFIDPHSYRRILIAVNQNTCQEIHSWRAWEDEAHMDRHKSLSEITRALTMRRQSTFVRIHTSNPADKNRFFIWVTCFFGQFGRSVVRSDYLTLRQGFITLLSVECPISVDQSFSYCALNLGRLPSETLTLIAGESCSAILLSKSITGYGRHLRLLVLLVGTKLQDVIATLGLECVGMRESFSRPEFKLRDELFWFKKPELLLSLIHFILFQWQFGYNSCFLRNHFLVCLRLILGFAGQFLCGYSTLPLYALVTQMGTNHKAALIPHSIRETIHVWRKAARRRRLGGFGDDSTVSTDTNTVISIEEYDDNQLLDSPRFVSDAEIELQPPTIFTRGHSGVDKEGSSWVGTALLQPSASISSPTCVRFLPKITDRSQCLGRGKPWMHIKF